MNFNFSLPQILNFFYMIFVLLVSLSVHESAHAYVAEKRGDPTGRMLGRITLNPLKHLDPIGSILVPALMFLFGLPVFGWARPVPVNTRNLRNFRLDNALVSAAGPLSNFCLSLVSTFSMAVYLALAGTERFYGELNQDYSVPRLLFMFSTVNLLLMAFNFIPIFPLDGSHVFEALLPKGPILELYGKIKPFGFMVLLFMIMTPVLGGVLKIVMNVTMTMFIFFPLSLVSAAIGR